MGDKVPPPAAGTQKTGIELVRGGPVGGGEKAAERFPGRGKFRFFVLALPEDPPEGLLAAVGEAPVVVGDALSVLYLFPEAQIMKVRLVVMRWLRCS